MDKKGVEGGGDCGTDCGVQIGGEREGGGTASERFRGGRAKKVGQAARGRCNID